MSGSSINKKDLTGFIKSQKLLALSTVDRKGNSWTSNVYYSADKDLNLFFVSSPDANHSQHIANNPQVSFSIAWYDEKDLANRKAVQGVGKCMRVKDANETMRLLRNHYKYYPLWENVITYKAMSEKLIESRPYIIRPKYMKFWNDELFGKEGVWEFNF